MNIITKICLTATLASGTIAFSQDKNVVITDLPVSLNQEYQFKGNWVITNIDENNTSFNLTGNQLVNNTKWTSNNLILDLYFVPNNSKHKIAELPNRLDRSTKLGKISGEGSAFNKVSITFQDRDLHKLMNGDYTAVVVLKDSHNKDAILNYKIIENNIHHFDEKVTIQRPISTIKATPLTPSTEMAAHPIGHVNVDEEQLDNKLSNVYTTVGSTVDFSRVANDIQLSGDWQLEVDFESYSVSIDGVNHAIENHKSDKTKNLKLLVYFSSEEVTNTEISGYELLNVDIQPIGHSAQLRAPKIKTNITKTLPSGVYYPVLILTEENDQGEYMLKSAIKFKEKYQL